MNKTTAGFKRGVITSSLVFLLSGGCTQGGNTGHDDGGGPGDDGGGTPTKHDGFMPLHGSGYITLYSYSFVSGGTTIKASSVSVGFGEPAMAPPCTVSPMGACQLSVCQNVMATSDGGTVTYPDAGKINVTGGTKAVALMPQPDGSYSAAVDTMNVLWNGGELLTVAGLGNKVPAFSTTLNAPNVAKLTMPTEPALGSKLMVNRNTDFVLKWTGGQGGSVQAVMSAFAMDTSTSVTCTFAASDSMGVIPAAALMKISAAMGSFAFTSANTKMLQAGTYDLTVAAQSLATGSGGSVTSYGVTYL